MNRQELKKILKEQAASFSSDVRKKMFYLKEGYKQGKNFYKENCSIPSEINDGIEVFSFKQGRAKVSNNFSEQKSVSVSEPFDGEKYNSLPVSKKKIIFEKRKQYFAQRIASLRGVSLPGDYLRHHS